MVFLGSLHFSLRPTNLIKNFSNFAQAKRAKFYSRPDIGKGKRVSIRKMEERLDGGRSQTFADIFNFVISRLIVQRPIITKFHKPIYFKDTQIEQKSV